MADFTVPNYSDLIDNLNPQIAAGAPKLDFSAISDALKNYDEGGKIRQDVDLRNMFRGGVPMVNGQPDYGTIGKQLLQIGGAGQVQSAIGLGNAQLGRDLISGSGAPAGPPSASNMQPNVGGQDPRGLRNNNPLNIESGSFTQSQPGFQGSDGRFAKFASLDQGVGAADNLLSSYGKRGLNTVSAIVNRWAPPGENDSNAYAGTVAKALGVDPNAPLNMADPQVRRGLIGAMAQVENGRPLPPQGNPVAQPGMDQGTANRYEQAATAYYQKSQAASLINPSMSAAFKSQADAYMKQAETIRGSMAKNSEMTPDIKNAQAAGQPNPLAYDTNKKLFSDDADAFTKENTGIQSAGKNAAVGMQQAQLLKNATLDPNFYSGPLSEYVKTYRQFQSIFGSDPGKAAPAELFTKVANNMLQQQIKSMGQSGVGRVLQAEVNIMRQSLASQDNTPLGNRALGEIVSRVYKQSQDIAQIARGLPRQPGKLSQSLDQASDDYLRSHPLFTQQELQRPQLLGAPDAPPQSAQWSPQQKQQWAKSIGLKSGDPIRFNGQIVQVP